MDLVWLLSNCYQKTSVNAANPHKYWVFTVLRFIPTLSRHAGYPAQKQYRSVRRRRWDRQNLCLPDRLHFTEKVCPAWTCRFSAGGDFYLQRCLTGLYHRRIHSVFIPDFSGEPCYLQTHPGNRKKRKRAFCL